LQRTFAAKYLQRTFAAKYLQRTFAAKYLQRTFAAKLDLESITWFQNLQPVLRHIRLYRKARG